MELFALLFVILPFVYMAGTMPKGIRLSKKWRPVWIVSVPLVFGLSGVVGNMNVPELNQIWTLMGGAGALFLLALLIIYVCPQLQSHE